MNSKVPVAVLISGRGSNLQALIEACRDPEFPAEIVKVISNEPDALGIVRAEAEGIPTVVVSHKGRSRDVFEEILLAHLSDVSFVCLAGFMRVLSPTFLAAFPERILNVHPALLPAFPGLHAQRQALQAGVTQTGCTVHIVDSGVDTGPILCQGSLAIHTDETEDQLSERIRKLEHVLLPMSLRWLAEGRVFIEGHRAQVVLRDGEKRWWVETD